MALPSPRHAVIGASDVEATVRFLVGLGFERGARASLPTSAAGALYGLERETSEVALRMPDAPAGSIRVVGTPHPAEPHHVFARGPHALDLYTTDTAKSLERAAAAGARCFEPATYRVGPLELTETKTVGPDGLAIVFIQAARRRPSLLDRHPERLHSEVHSLVFTVDSVTEAMPFWKERAGLQAFLDATIVEPAVAAFMGLPRPDTPLRLAMLADGESRPARLELLEFPQDAGPHLSTWPLRPGFHAAGFEVPSLGDAMRLLEGARFGEPVEVDTAGLPRARAVTAVAPGGVRFEVWERA